MTQITEENAKKLASYVKRSGVEIDSDYIFIQKIRGGEIKIVHHNDYDYIRESVCYTRPCPAPIKEEVQDWIDEVLDNEFYQSKEMFRQDIDSIPTPQHLHNLSWNKNINEWLEIVFPILDKFFEK